jgi:enoyl-CoA hydratase/carnithine racemase
MAYNTLDWQIDERVLTLTLNRPAQLNAFTVEMANELIDAYQRASEDDAVGAIVVTGAGKAFCAGMDLSVGGNVFGLDETLNPTLAEQDARWDDPVIVNGVRDTGGRVSLAVYECKKPIIAAINGAAVGIGATMTLPMDVRLASDKARIGFVFGRIGIGRRPAAPGSCRASSACSRRWTGSIRPTSSRPSRPWRAACSKPWCRTNNC